MLNIISLCVVGMHIRILKDKFSQTCVVQDGINADRQAGRESASLVIDDIYDIYICIYIHTHTHTHKCHPG